MKIISALFIIPFLFLNVLNAQNKEKKKITLKAPKLNLMEKVGDLTGNLMTKKTDQLDGAVGNAYIISGIYPTDIKTSESKYFPEYASEGDYMVGISFMKNEGMGMFEIEGEITCDGKPMQYVGLGSYLTHFPEPFTSTKNIEIKTNAGDVSSLKLSPTHQIELLTINGESTLPVIDLAEDLTIEFTNPAGAEGSYVNVALITDVMGVRALNRFADIKATAENIQKVTIPREALSNPEIAGSVKGVGNYNKGENYLIVERQVIIAPHDVKNLQDIGDLPRAEIKMNSYSSIPVIVKGKQDESVYASIKVGERKKHQFGYEMYKPNARSGIPFSKGSKFGLVSFTLNGKTFEQKTDTRTESWTVGYTRYTRTTSTTNTYKFPQLPDSHWETFMHKMYTEISNVFSQSYNIEFVPVENITSSQYYTTLFPPDDKNSTSFIKTSYKNTHRSSPRTFSEIFGSVSSNKTSDVPVVNLMKETEADGLVSLALDFNIAANENNKIILIPFFTFSISGRDEEKNDVQGKYLDGLIAGGYGVPFNEDAIKANPDLLFETLSGPLIIETFKDGLQKLRAKEIELGYDKIWNIGE